MLFVGQGADDEIWRVGRGGDRMLVFEEEADEVEKRVHDVLGWGGGGEVYRLNKVFKWSSLREWLCRARVEGTCLAESLPLAGGSVEYPSTAASSGIGSGRGIEPEMESGEVVGDDLLLSVSASDTRDGGAVDANESSLRDQLKE